MGKEILTNVPINFNNFNNIKILNGSNARGFMTMTTTNTSMTTTTMIHGDDDDAGVDNHAYDDDDDYFYFIFFINIFMHNIWCSKWCSPYVQYIDDDQFWTLGYPNETDLGTASVE